MDKEELDKLRQRVIDEDTTSFGLISVYKRLRLLYGDECRLDIDSTPGEGTSISIHIPGKAEIENETIL